MFDFSVKRTTRLPKTTAGSGTAAAEPPTRPSNALPESPFVLTACAPLAPHSPPGVAARLSGPPGAAPRPSGLPGAPYPCLPATALRAVHQHGRARAHPGCTPGCTPGALPVRSRAWRRVPSHFGMETPFDTAVSMTRAVGGGGAGGAAFGVRRRHVPVPARGPAGLPSSARGPGRSSPAECPVPGARRPTRRTRPRPPSPSASPAAAAPARARRPSPACDGRAPAGRP